MFVCNYMVTSFVIALKLVVLIFCFMLFIHMDIYNYIILLAALTYLDQQLYINLLM